MFFLFFFFNDTATTEIYTLSLHDALPISRGETQALVTTTLGTPDDMQRIERFEGETKKRFMLHYNFPPFSVGEVGRMTGDRKSTRLNSSHLVISYAVFCLKKKKDK